MHKGVIRALVLCIVFVISLVGFEILTNHTNEDLTTEMAEATLPVITLYDEQTAINELHGYLAKMNALYMRDTITPISADRLLDISILTYQTQVDTISYEIRSLDTSVLIANSTISSFEDVQGTIRTSLEIQNLLEEDMEYLLTIELGCGENTVTYYTRIIQPKESYVEECLEFVSKFNKTTFQKEKINDLSGYMESTTGDNTTLHFVSLNSSLAQVGWGDFEVKYLTTPVPSIKEITPTYNVIVLDYVVTSIGEKGEMEYYNVEEYYRVRYTNSRIYLLNFERTTNQIFRGENFSFSQKEISLGIRSKEVDYKSNEAGTVVAFVQEGELWCFDENENTLSKIFSFRGYEGIDNRENYGEHGIKVISIDEAGSVNYIVYGYMNRGIHEGETGIAIYHYDSLLNTNEEFVFIPGEQSYELLKSELGQLMYVNEGGMCYLMMDGIVYGIDLNTLEYKQVISGLSAGTFSVSESNRYLAWIDGKKRNDSDTIQVMDFSNEITFPVGADQGQYLKPLGFMGEDFIYGVARQTEVQTDAAGNTIFPMFEIRIMDTASENHGILKTYQKDGYYIAGITMSNDTIYLNRMQLNESTYIDADQDMIMNRVSETGEAAVVSCTNDEVKQTVVQISLSNEISKKTVKLLTPKEIILTEERIANLQSDMDSWRYYVYAKGDVLYTSDSIADAVEIANNNMGVVVGNRQQYVWKRSRKTTQPAFSNLTIGAEDQNSDTIAQCVSIMLQREDINISVGALLASEITPLEILRDTLKDMDVLDLTGCQTEEILYYINCGNPVFAMTSSDTAVLVVGYDTTSVMLFDPATADISKLSFDEADALFAAAGNVFISYNK